MPVLVLLSNCGNYRDFALSPQPGGSAPAWQWKPEPAPALERGASPEWDSVDVLNPSVFRHGREYWNLYSGFDGKTWHTGLAVSADGIAWRKRGKILSPDPNTWEGRYIAANGSAIEHNGEILYYYQAGLPFQIGLARSRSEVDWKKNRAPVIPAGPYGSWDEKGIGDPYAIRLDGRLYLFYTGIDRARRQRLGIAVSDDGITWYKLRSNPILELGDYGSFDENGLGEPAVWVSQGYYWMLYTGRDRNEFRRMGMARSRDGAHWEKTGAVFAGNESWDSKVICDPSVIVESGRVRVWFGGGDVARPDENIHGQIGYAILQPVSGN